jgi:NADH:ubiquinone oxidoreductase subunit F (NADH-binding)/(2Fe-2S) ferredoxin/Pyruvate/2-oxoacid:ferredoxin oxidoreductase delta subunit
MNKVKTQLKLCGGIGCKSSDSQAFREALIKELALKKLTDSVEIVDVECQGYCGVGPVMHVEPEGVLYQKLTPEIVSKLVEEHLINGKPLKKFLYTPPAPKDSIPKMEEIPFYANQMLWVMRNKGAIDPEVIDEYIARDGYLGVAKALKEMTSEEVISEIKTSGIRGRGGAGFPTGLKWEFAYKSPGDIKYVLCNADEGDPGAFMDRSVLEADPHAVLEGMIIAAKAINARQGYIYARTEYPLAIRRLGIAIKQAREYGLLGKDILGTGFDFEIDIYQGAGAFVCGEETALMRSIEGKRGMPRPRPPFPALRGLWEKPTILNNVETLANIAQIILKGGKWYSSVGTEGSKGTKVFALSGDVNNIGLVEVPMGTSLRSLIFDIGGGVPDKKRFKAVQLGGPSGGCVPESHLDIPIDYEEIAKVGAIMGSGGAIVMDHETCMVDMARFFMDFVQDESCGKCTPCREGTKRLLEILERICEGKGEPSDIETLEELSGIIKDATLCGLGQTGPNPVLSTLRYFKDEYEAHIYEKRCPAKRCVGLLKFEVNPEICTMCGACFRACPTGAIDWKKKEPARIDREKCIKCMTCFEKCKFDAIF